MKIEDERCIVKCLTCETLLLNPITGQPESFMTKASGRMVANRRGWNVNYEHNQFLCLSCNARRNKTVKKRISILMQRAAEL